MTDDLTAEDSQTFKFGVSNSKYGYYITEDGADTFYPFSRNYTSGVNGYFVLMVRQSQSVCTADLSFIDGYEDLTIDDLDVGIAYYQWITGASSKDVALTFGYESSTGTLTVTADASSFWQSASTYQLVNFIAVFVNSELETYIPTSYSTSELTFDMTSVSDYQNKTYSNFVPIYDNVRYMGTSSNNMRLVHSYDSSTGVLTCSSMGSSAFSTVIETAGIKIAVV